MPCSFQARCPVDVTHFIALQHSFIALRHKGLSWKFGLR
jgi:hypothetical protein